MLWIIRSLFGLVKYHFFGILDIYIGFKHYTFYIFHLIKICTRTSKKGNKFKSFKKCINYNNQLKINDKKK